MLPCVSSFLGENRFNSCFFPKEGASGKANIARLLFSQHLSYESYFFMSSVYWVLLFSFQCDKYANTLNTVKLEISLKYHVKECKKCKARQRSSTITANPSLTWSAPPSKCNFMSCSCSLQLVFNLMETNIKAKFWSEIAELVQIYLKGWTRHFICFYLLALHVKHQDSTIRWICTSTSINGGNNVDH